MRRKPRNVHFLILYKKASADVFVDVRFNMQIEFQNKIQKYTFIVVLFVQIAHRQFQLSRDSMEFCEQKPILQKAD